jgi:hypothetical protein
MKTMARKNDRDLLDKLRAGGLRKSVARTLAGASKSKPKGRAAKAIDDSVARLRSVTSILERRAEEARRSEAGKKAALSRKRNAAKRSAAAKRGAKTRAKAGK